MHVTVKATVRDDAAACPSLHACCLLPVVDRGYAMLVVANKLSSRLGSFILTDVSFRIFLGFLFLSPGFDYRGDYPRRLRHGRCYSCSHAGQVHRDSRREASLRARRQARRQARR